MAEAEKVPCRQCICRQCRADNHDNCLGVVYSHGHQEFKECGCGHV